MGTFLYDPAGDLGPIEAGDAVEVIDSQGAVRGEAVVRSVGKLSVTTKCGRQWTRQHGEYISEMRGKKVTSWPFPSIRKKLPSPLATNTTGGA